VGILLYLCISESVFVSVYPISRVGIRKYTENGENAALRPPAALVGCALKRYISRGSRIVTVLGMESESSAAAASATATEWDGLAAQSADCSSVGFDSVSQVFMWHQVGGSRSRAFWLTCPLR